MLAEEDTIEEQRAEEEEEQERFADDYFSEQVYRSEEEPQNQEEPQVGTGSESESQVSQIYNNAEEEESSTHVPVNCSSAKRIAVGPESGCNSARGILSKTIGINTSHHLYDNREDDDDDAELLPMDARYVVSQRGGDFTRKKSRSGLKRRSQTHQDDYDDGGGADQWLKRRAKRRPQTDRGMKFNPVQ